MADVNLGKDREHYCSVVVIGELNEFADLYATEAISGATAYWCCRWSEWGLRRRRSWAWLRWPGCG